MRDHGKYKWFKRIISIILAVSMCLPAFPMRVKAANVTLSAEQVANYMNSQVGKLGYDGMCLAFVADSFQKLGATRSSACCAYNYGNSHIQSTDMSNIPIGADVFFGNCGGGPCSKCGSSYFGHIGVYVGNGQFVHATGGKVQKTAVNSSYWGSRFRGWGYHSNVTISGGSSTPSHTVDQTYAPFTPFKTYAIATGNINVYQENGTQYSNRYITGSTDLCTIKEVYTDGWCKVQYPSSAEASGYFEAYVKLDVFTAGKAPVSWTCTGNYTAYRRSDLASSLGSVDKGDRCLLVNDTGAKKQVIYPVSGAGYYKMGWVNIPGGSIPSDSDFPTPILAYNHSADTRTPVYQFDYTLGGTKYGEIFVDDLCTINSVSLGGRWVNVTYPTSSQPKTGYCYIDQFFPSLGGISKPYKTRVSTNTPAYRKADMATKIGDVYPEDTITVVGKAGNLYQIMYPVTVGSNAGKYKLGWIYGNNIVKNLTGISVTTRPNKTVYLEGESFSTAGMVVTATYDDGSTAAVSGYSCSGYTSTPGSKTITISYSSNGVTKTTAIDVTVNSKSPTALTVTAQPTKTSYFVGEDFDEAGMKVRATYNNNTSADVTNYYTSYDFSSAGTKKVTIKYQYNGVTVSTSVNVNVVEPTLSGITVASKPSKVDYYVGDTLDTTGLTLQATYNDGRTETVSSGFSCSPTILNNAGTQTITVSYGGKQTTFSVTVKELAKGTMTVADASGMTGEMVRVPIRLDNNPGIIAMRLQIAYDSSVLKLLNVEDGGILGDHVFGGNLAANPYTVLWENGLAKDNYTQTGNLVVLVFEIAENAPEGKSAVQVTYDPEEIYNKDLRNVNFTVKQGSVEVQKAEEDIQILTQPEDCTASVGETVHFTVKAEGSGLTYQWQYSTNGRYWFDSGMTGSKTSSLTVGVTEKRNGQMYRCMIKDSSGRSLVSNVATLTVDSSQKFEIIQQPENKTAEEGGKAVFTVKATGDGLTYQWQYSTNGRYWYNSGMTGSKTSSLTVEALPKRNGQMYRCIVTDRSGSTLTSSAATLTVSSSAQFEITQQPKSQTVAEGSKAVFTVKAVGEGLTYQWQYSTSGKYWYNSGMTGSKTSNLTVEALPKRNGQMYRCIVTDRSGSTLTSEAATLTVGNSSSQFAITQQPKSQTAREGSNAVFTVKATGEGLTYQWQYSTTGKYWYNSGMTGSKTSSLTVEALAKRNGQMYRCVVTNADMQSLTSEAAVLTIQ